MEQSSLEPQRDFEHRDVRDIGTLGIKFNHATAKQSIINDSNCYMHLDLADGHQPRAVACLFHVLQNLGLFTTLEEFQRMKNRDASNQETTEGSTQKGK
jgi:hypothetical protein